MDKNGGYITWLLLNLPIAFWGLLGPRKDVSSQVADLRKAIISQYCKNHYHAIQITLFGLGVFVYPGQLF